MEAKYIQGVKTVSLKEIYKILFETDDELFFIPFLNYHRINYEPYLDCFPIFDTDVILNPEYPNVFHTHKTVDLLLKYSAISHLLIDLRNHFKGYDDLDKHFSSIYNRILLCLDKVEEIFIPENQ